MKALLVGIIAFLAVVVLGLMADRVLNFVSWNKKPKKIPDKEDYRSLLDNTGR